MSAPAAMLERPSAARVDAIARSVDDVAAFLRLPSRDVRRAIERNDLPHLRVSTGRVVVLEGDAQALLGSPPEGGDTIEAAFRGCWRIRLTHVAAALGVCTKTLQTEAEAGRFPAFRSHAGRWHVLREDLVRWLRDRRVPARSEAA